MSSFLRMFVFTATVYSMLISSIQHTCVFSRYSDSDLSLLSGTHSLPDCSVLMPDLPVLIFGHIPQYQPCLFLTSLFCPRPGKLPYLLFDLVSAFSHSDTVCCVVCCGVFTPVDYQVVNKFYVEILPGSLMWEMFFCFQIE